MSKIPVFAGLGSDVLFNDDTRDRAFQDVLFPQANLLAEACHRSFRYEVSLASEDFRGALRIDLGDFKTTRDLLEPCIKYRRHPVVQNSTLCLLQLLRYLNLEGDRKISQPDNEAAAGFCSGLFAAVAVATAGNTLQFLARGEECFRAALLMGIASYRASRNATHLIRLDAPWSLVVANIEESEISQMFSDHKRSRELAINISSVNSSTCFTLSGEGKDLQDFVRSRLTAKCSVKPTNIFSPYHNQGCMEIYLQEILDDFKRRRLSFPGRKDLLIPLISTIDGAPLRSSDAESDTDLLNDILSMTLIEPTNWIAVQDTIISLAKASSDEAPGRTTSVWNYGPGYGCRKNLDPEIEVRDVAFQSSTAAFQENDIAIVGIGIDLPDAPDLETLWQNLINELNSCTEIPEDRFNIEDYYTGDDCKPLNKRRSLNTKYGNFLEDPFSFDNQLFGISPREASSIDPQQRILLQTVYRALENAGYVADSTPSFARDQIGCFIGNATLDYVDNLKNNIDIYYSPGTLRAFLSGRISYAFKWSGPSVTVDTACSSSLVALYQAARAIAAGDCRTAIAGGVNIITSPDMYMGLDKAHFLSPTGQCKAFDESADGYCRGEGCATFVLKRLSDAVSENDRIWGVIKGIQANQSGNTTSITHPHSPTQEDLFQKLLAKSGISATDVSVAEAHGTGTQAGDPNELRSIRNVFARGRKQENPLRVTSIKSNIGHLEAASGAAALAKLLMMLKHKRIPPQALLQSLNDSIDDLETDGTIIPIEACDWHTQGEKPRIALLNNFGAAGSNAALLLQEYQSNLEDRTEQLDSLTYVFGCSAPTQELLEQCRKNLVAYLNLHKETASIADICYTSTARRGLQRYRLSTTAASIDDLIARLEKTGMFEVPDTPRPNVFLFGGQGAQYIGMGKGMMELSPIFKTVVLHCNELLTQWGFPGCLDVISSSTTEGIDIKDPRTLQAFQTGVFVTQVALAQILAGFGIRPDMVTGHSLGEYSALVVAEVLDLESGLWLVAERARLIVEKCKLWETGMLAVGVSAEKVRHDVLGRRVFNDLTIACENSPNDCVVGGDKETLEQLKEHASKVLNTRSAMLDVPVAYHTAALDPILDDLRKSINGLSLKKPTISIASNALGRVVQAGEEAIFTPEYFVAHCRGTVAFDTGISDILNQGDDFESARWIEIGPHPMLLPMVAQQLTGADSQKLPTLKKNMPAHQTIAELLSEVYKDGPHSVSWRKVFESLPSKPTMTELPLFPMNKKHFLVPLPREVSQEDESLGLSDFTPFTLLERQLEMADDGTATFETPIQSLGTLISGHVVCGHALCPASVYTEMALAAANCLESDMDDVTFKITDIKFLRPLVFDAESTQTVRVVLRPEDSGKEVRAFEISSITTGDESPRAKLHCSGKIKAQSWLKATGKMRSTERALSRRKSTFEDGEHQTFSARLMYNKIFSRVVEYGKQYQAVKKIYLDEQLEEIFASCVLPVSTAESHYAGQPILLDTMLHVAGFAANLNVDNDAVCICQHVNSTSMLRKDIPPGHAFEVHCSNFTSTKDPDCILADAQAVDAEGIIAIIQGMEFRRSDLTKVRTAFDIASQTPSRMQSKAVTQPPSRKQSTPSSPRSPGSRPRRTVQSRPDSRRSSAESLKLETVDAALTSATPSQGTVFSILSEATGVQLKDITPRTELSAMGVDSIMIFELDKKLEQAMGCKPSVAELTACKTAGDMDNLVSASASRGASPMKPCNRRRSSLRQTKKDTQRRDSKTPDPTLPRDEVELSPRMNELLRQCFGSSQNPERVQRHHGASKPSPLYLVHPGAGIALHYHRLGNLNRDVHAIHDARLLAEKKDDWKSLNEVAEHYASMIRKDVGRSASEVILGGWSFGGVIAFEAARILHRSSDYHVQGVVLIDPPSPLDHEPISRKTIEVAMETTQKKTANSRTTASSDYEDAIAALTIRNNLRRAALLGKHTSKKGGPMPRVVLLRSEEGLSLPVQVPANKWLHDRSDVETSVADWEKLMGRSVDVIDIPGDHFTPFEKENIEGTTNAVRKACEILENRR